MLRPKGFTLIELLIVVAIIAILAAIAVPNFLEAQTRSKVSRVKADFRSVATALETYRVDHNWYPLNYHNSPGGTRNNESPYWSGTYGVLRANAAFVLVQLTTPVSYLSAVISDDIFRPAGRITVSGVTVPENSYWFAATNNNIPLYWREKEGSNWCIQSYGPNRLQDWVPCPNANEIRSALNPNPYYFVAYDPTNGTVSAGDIVRYSDGQE